MAFTPKDRTELERARQRVHELAAKEREALSKVTHAIEGAGLLLAEGCNWSDVAHVHADAIRDALEPFDSGVRPAQDTAA